MDHWAAEQRVNVRVAYEVQHDLIWLGDRDADLWLPLFAVCSVVAPDRLPDLKNNALTLSGAKQAQDGENTTSLRLLGDLRRIWSAREPHEATCDLIERLRGLEESGWDERLTAYKLGKLLRAFQISSRNIRLGQVVRKGYLHDDLEPVWTRYLSPLQQNTATNVTTRINTDEDEQIESATKPKCSGLENALSPA